MTVWYDSGIVSIGLLAMGILGITGIVVWTFFIADDVGSGSTALRRISHA